MTNKKTFHLENLHNHICKCMDYCLKLKDSYTIQYCESGVGKEIVDDTDLINYINQKEPLEINTYESIEQSARKEINGLSTYIVSCKFLKSEWDGSVQTIANSPTYNMVGYLLAKMLDTLILKSLIENASAPTINLEDGTWENSNKIDIDIKNIIKSLRRQSSIEPHKLFLDYNSYDYAEDFYNSPKTKKQWKDGNVERIQLKELDCSNDYLNDSVSNGIGLWYCKYPFAPAVLYSYSENSNEEDIMNNLPLVKINFGEDKYYQIVEFVMKVGVAVIFPKAVGHMNGFLTPKNNSNKK